MKTPAVIAAATLAAVILSAAAPAAARTPLERHLATRGYLLPNVIPYDELYQTAFAEGMVDIEQMLAQHEVKIQGDGDSRYVRKADLLRICGKKCGHASEWGIFLSNFAVLKHRK